MTRHQKHDYTNLVQRGRIHRSAYTDPDVFAVEMIRVFGGTWTYLGHESELPEPYDFKLTNLGLRPVILTRDGDGTIHGLFNRCSHRGVTVCAEPSGNARRFVCSYHGWTYLSDGRLAAVPFASSCGPEFDQTELGLGRVSRIDTHRGFIFGVLAPEAPSLHDYLGPVAERIDEWVDRSPAGELVVRHRVRKIAADANWKLYVDGAADGIHPLFVHRSYLTMGAERDGEGLFLSEFASGLEESGMYSQTLPHGHQFLDQRPSLLPSKWAATRAMPGTEAAVELLTARHGERVDEILEQTTVAGMNIFVFPNLSLVDNSIGVVQPRAVDRTEVHWHITSLADLDPVAVSLRMRIGEDFPNFGDTDDVEQWERAQRGLRDVPEVQWLRTTRGLGLDPEADDRGVSTVPITSEAPMRSYHTEWQRLMGLEPNWLDQD